MRINWKVRLANRTFWIEMVPALLLVVQLVLDLFGIKVDFGEIGNKIMAIINAVFVVLSLLGIVTDPTTAGLDDSVRAMGYEEPWEDAPNK